MLTHRRQQSRKCRPYVLVSKAQGRPVKLPSPGNEAAVRARFAQAGLSNSSINAVLRAYPHYLNWDPDTKLGPAVASWQQELGRKQFASDISQAPRLLLYSVQRHYDIIEWLSSMGVPSSSSALLIASPVAALQATAAMYQAKLELTDEALAKLIIRSPGRLTSPAKKVDECIEAIAGLLGVPTASEKVRKIINRASAYTQKFHCSAARIAPGVLFFAEKYGNGPGARETALLHYTYNIPPSVMQARAQHIQSKLDLSDAELRTMLSAFPQCLRLQSTTLDANLDKFSTSLQFSWDQVRSVCIRDPSMMARDWESKLQIEKLSFLRSVMQLSTQALADNYKLLMSSLPNRIGPRYEFLLHLVEVGHMKPEHLHHNSRLVHLRTDALFTVKFGSSAPASDVHYNQAFQSHWKQRWAFMTKHMQISIEDMAANRPLLLTSVKDTLGPRWAFFMLLSAHQEHFCAVDHLPNLALLHDSKFAELYGSDVGASPLVYDADFRHRWQDANAHMWQDV